MGVGEFFGHRLKARTIGSLNLTEYVYAPRTDTPRHEHAQAYVNLVLEGGYTERIGRRLREPIPSCVLYHPPGESHADRFGAAQTRIFSMEMGPAFLGRFGDCALPSDRAVMLGAGPAAGLAGRLYAEFRRPDAATQVEVHALAWELLALLLTDAGGQDRRRAQGRPPTWLVSARGLLHDRFAEHITLYDLAATIGVHPLHLAREFRRYFHCTVGCYIRRLRVEEASRALLHTDESLVCLAHRLGFADQSHFTRVFARRMGAPPGRFRCNRTKE